MTRDRFKIAAGLAVHFRFVKCRPRRRTMLMNDNFLRGVNSPVGEMVTGRASVAKVANAPLPPSLSALKLLAASGPILP